VPAQAEDMRIDDRGLVWFEEERPDRLTADLS